MNPVESRMPELVTSNPSDRIALRGVRVRSRLSGMSQKTIVAQTYVNLEPAAIEAVYTFPLPENAAVCGFEIVTGKPDVFTVRVGNIRFLVSSLGKSRREVETWLAALPSAGIRVG